MMEQYRYPCGAFEECSAEELWKNEIACALTGCEACIHFNGTVYYVRNIPEGVWLWAKHEVAERR